MIFVTLGSQKFQMNRLLETLDSLIENKVIQDEIIVQSGACTYTPKYLEVYPFLDKDKFNEYMSKADLVISHGGTGAIVTALKHQKKVIAVPRLAKYGEHVDDHQLQICDTFLNKEYIEVCYEMEDLKELYKLIQTKEYKLFESNNHVFVNDLIQYIDLL